MNDNIRWGLHWGVAGAVVTVALGPVSALLTGKLDALFSLEGLIVLLIGVPTVCITAGLVVGLFRPIASRGVIGAIIVGAVLGFVLGGLILLTEMLIASRLSGDPTIFIVGVMIVGGILGGLLGGIFMPMLRGEAVTLWKDQS